jgi:hypothetical protein
MPQTVLPSIVPQDARPNTPERSDHRDLSRRVSGGRIKNHSAAGARDRKKTSGIATRPTQIRTAEILLRKCVPDLMQTDITGAFTHRYVVEAPAQLSRDEWVKEYSPPAEPTIQ